MQQAQLLRGNSGTDRGSSKKMHLVKTSLIWTRRRGCRGSGSGCGAVKMLQRPGAVPGSQRGDGRPYSLAANQLLCGKILTRRRSRLEQRGDFSCLGSGWHLMLQTRLKELNAMARNFQIQGIFPSFQCMLFIDISWPLTFKQAERTASIIHVSLRSPMGRSFQPLHIPPHSHHLLAPVPTTFFQGEVTTISNF